MKILLQIIFTLIASVCISCNDSEAIAGKPEARIAQFTLQCGDTYYRGNINDESKVIRISGITSRKAITGVNYQLSGGSKHLPRSPESEALGNRTAVHRDKQRQSANL
ncbi:DUF4971 domain-containing protein [Bacteroides faecium]|uniref:DUF4971 domain-containing protein n=1 Tax=Bacteroides faecium TaxID=2715212 RepID=A0A6H0KKR4_9BACE|nr:DUF4971 domain-containing protein [Bacteroides faecium]QIU93168.1 DUF4971 domain-containing protein [Bacteroides faecium]